MDFKEAECLLSKYFLLGFDFTTVFTSVLLSDGTPEIGKGLTFFYRHQFMVIDPSLFFKSEVFLQPRIWCVLVNVVLCKLEKRVFCCWMK